MKFEVEEWGFGQVYQSIMLMKVGKVDILYMSRAIELAD